MCPRGLVLSPPPRCAVVARAPLLVAPIGCDMSTGCCTGKRFPQARMGWALAVLQSSKCTFVVYGHRKAQMYSRDCQGSVRVRNMDAARVITSAIEIGVPLFNSGDAAACAAVYANAMVDLLDMTPAMLRPKLVDALELSSSSRDNTERAWILRRALDDLLAASAASSPARTTMLSSGAGSCPPPARGLDVAHMNWDVVDDRVMGGRSRSRMDIQPDGCAVFQGELVVAEGGFASVRANLPSRGFGMIGAKGLVLQCAGDGRVGYKMTLKTDTARDGVMYQASFSAPASPATFTLPFTSFRASFRGMPVPNAPPVRGDDVLVLGFMLSRVDAAGGYTDEPSGPFSLRIASVSSC